MQCLTQSSFPDLKLVTSTFGVCLQCFLPNQLVHVFPAGRLVFTLFMKQSRLIAA